jgi:hypothetical protein
MIPPPWPPSELVRLAWTARRDIAARQQLLQAFHEGADFHSPLSSSDLNNDLFTLGGKSVIVVGRGALQR